MTDIEALAEKHRAERPARVALVRDIEAAFKRALAEQGADDERLCGGAR